jgi:hypothetical protein
MVLADAERIQANLIGMFDLLDQVGKTDRRTNRTAGVIVRRSEAINADLHSSLPIR